MNEQIHTFYEVTNLSKYVRRIVPMQNWCKLRMQNSNLCSMYTTHFYKIFLENPKILVEDVLHYFDTNTIKTFTKLQQKKIPGTGSKTIRLPTPTPP